VMGSDLSCSPTFAGVEVLPRGRFAVAAHGGSGIDLRAAGAAPRSSPAFAPGGAPPSGSTPSESHSLGSLTLTEGVSLCTGF